MSENGNENKHKLTDFIDIELLQALQDAFAQAANVASIAVDEKGSITKPSNFTDFCIKFTRGSKLGLKRCIDCDIKWGKVAAAKGEPVIYDCHTGLTDFAVPIIVDGVHIASILGGQVLTKEPDEEHFRQIARDLSIDEDDYIREVKKIKVVPLETVKAATNLLYLVANAISAIGNRTLEIFKKNERETLYRKVTEAVRSSLDVDETKKIITEVVGKTLGADRCFIMEYDKASDKFLLVTDEYLSSSGVASYKGFDINVEVPEFAAMIKKGEKVIINHNEIFAARAGQSFELEKSSIERHNVKSAAFIPLYYGDELLGAIGLHFVKKAHSISEADINLLNIFANQVSVAIYQAKQFKLAQLQSERERLLREITEKTRSSLDLDEVLTFICEETAKLFDVERTAITVFPDPTNFEEYVVKKEYKTSSKIKGYKQGKNFSKAASYFGKTLLLHDVVLSFDNVQDANVPEYFKNIYTALGVKSILATSIRKGNEVWGTLVFSEYEEYRQWTAEEKKMIKAIASQVFLAINQAELFQALRQTTANQDAILKNMPFLAWLKDDKGRVLAVNEAFAKMCNTTIENLIGKTDFDFWPKELAEAYVADDLRVMQAKQTISTEEVIDSPDGRRVHETFKSPVFNNDGKVVGTVGLSRDVTDRKEAELELLRRQELIVKAAQRETILKEIIEAVRNSLDIEEIKHTIVNSLCRTFKAERCFLVEYDEALKDFKPISIEALNSPVAKSIMGFDAAKEIPELAETSRLGLDIIIRDGQNYILENNLQGTNTERYINNYQVESGFSIPIYFQKKLFGVLALHYTESKYAFDDETIQFVTEVAAQAGVAINQASLFKITQIQAERETILRKIIETIRGSIDIDVVKHVMVNQIGEYFSADRVAFADYNLESDNYFTLEGNEYRSSDEIKTFVGFDFASTPGFIEDIRKIHTEGQDIIFSDLDQYLLKKNLKGSSIENFYKDMGFSSSMAININYGEMFYGNLVVTFEKKRIITEDDIIFTKTLANQAGVAINQAEMYEQEKKVAKRELFLREVVATIRSTQDSNQMKKQIVTQIGEFLNVERCIIHEINQKTGKFNVIDEFSEYKSLDSLVSYVGIDIEEESLKFFRDMFIRGDEMIAPNWPEYLNNLSDVDAKTKEWILTLEIKSDYVFPIIYADKQLAVLYLTYTKRYENISDDDLSSIRLLVNQAAIALYQSNLFEETKKQAERERLLRNITETIRKSLNLKETKKNIVNEIGNGLRADNVFLVEFDPETKTPGVLDADSQYLSSPDVISYVGFDFSSSEVEFLANMHRSNRSIIIQDVKKFIAENNLQNTKAEKWILDSKLKSAVGLAITYGEKIYGVLAIHYTKNSVSFTDEQIKFFENLANQAGIALSQAKLFEETKKQAAREKIIATVISKAIITFDLNDFKKIVYDIGTLTEADRCYFVDVDLGNMKGVPVNSNSEYLASLDIKTIVGYDFPNEDVSQFVECYMKTRDLWVFDYEDISKDKNEDYPGIKQYGNLFELKTSVGIPFFFDNKLNAVLCIEYVKERKIPSEDELNFLRILGNQSGIVFNQILLYQKEKKTAQIEKLVRELIEAVRSSLDIKTVKENLLEGLCKTFNADRCYFRAYDRQKEKFLPVDIEYLSSPETKSLIGVEPNQEGLKYFTDEVRRLKKGFYPIVADEEFAKGTPLADYMKASEIIADYAMPMINIQDEWLWLVLHYSKEDPKFNEDTKRMLESIAYQVDIAINQIKLFDSVNHSAQREIALRKITEQIRNSLDLDETLSVICEETAKMFNVDRVTIVQFLFNNNFQDFTIRKEYKKRDSIQSPQYIPDYKIVGEFLAEECLKKESPLAYDDIATSDSPDFLKKFYAILGVKSLSWAPIMSENQNWGFIVLSSIDEYKEWTNEDIYNLKSVSNQIYTAINQASLYKITQDQANTEAALRRIIDIIRTSMSVDEIKMNFVTETAKYFKADRCFIYEYGQSSAPGVYSEYTSSPNVKKMSEDDFSKPQYKAWEEDMFVINYGKPTLVFDMEKHIVENNLQDTPVDWHRKEYNIKSALGIPIIAANQNYGSLILQYTDNVVEFSEQELEFINIIANQAGIALHQAKLFEITKLQAERERISKNMVEILRSTLDKNIIKHLFVKNIGELLKADRVFFSEFDPKSGIYITVDKNSEYLSSPKEKSFVGFDWSDESVSEHIQPLLQRRELNIPSWEEYVKDCQKGPEFIALFEDASVKSSYNFPVLYEDKMMGFFCIEFTQEVHKLSNEDINRIRNICTQTAIALYHSGLLLKAQEATRSKAEFISNITNEFKVPLNFIIEFSELLAKTELERSKQIAYLNGISANGRQLLELTDDIIDISEIESDMFKLHYEHVDSEKLIREVLNSFHFMLLEKNINIETVLVSANVNADRKMLTKIIHILLTNAIKFSQKNGKIIITSALDDDRLFLSIEDTGIGTYADEHDLIFDELKQVDTAYTRRQQGSGLGLSIAKKLVELHNGNIHVESAGMKGSRFWLTLPRAYKVD